MSVRLNALRKQFDDAKAGIAAIDTKAAAEGRDLTDAEQADSSKLYTRCEELTPDITAEAARVESLNATSDILARVTPRASGPLLLRTAPEKSEPKERTVGDLAEYLSLRYRTEVLHDDEAAELLTRTVADVTTADTPGILPVPILGPLLKFEDNDRPVVSSTTQRPHPGTKTWTRPELYEHVAVGLQTAELDELASNQFSITGDVVTNKTYGGYLRISEQEIDFTDPAAIQICLDDFRGRYARKTEEVACTALLALGASTTTYTGTNIGTIIASYVNAIEKVYTQSETDADTIWLARDVYAALASSVTTQEQSTMAVLRAALANELGRPVRIVRASKLTAGTRIIGASQYIESYERDKGFVQQLDVGHLGVIIAYRGYFANWGAAKAFTKLA